MIGRRGRLERQQVRARLVFGSLLVGIHSALVSMTLTMLSGRSSPSSSTPQSTSSPSSHPPTETSDLIRHVTEIRAILNNNSEHNGSKDYICEGTSTTLSSDNSSSPITVLLTGDEAAAGLDGGRTVEGRIGGGVGQEHEQTNTTMLCPFSTTTHQPCRFIQPTNSLARIKKLKRIRTTLWIDRTLFILGVVVPFVVGVCFFVVHSFTEFASCLPTTSAVAKPEVSSRFYNEVCRAKLIQVVLQGAKDVDNEERVMGSLQHECFPIILILVALLNCLPHYCWRRAVRESLFRDVSLVSSELRGFRKAAQRELVSMASGTTFSLLQQQQPASLLTPVARDLRFKNTTPIKRISGPYSDMTSPVDTGYESEMDLPSVAVKHLPELRVSRDDHALTLFLAGWQNTNFYFRRFLAKHVVLGLFNMTALLLVIALCGLTQGAPFSGVFYCRPQENTKQLYTCLASTTFALNVVTFTLGGLALVGIACSVGFFHRNFSHKFVYGDSTLACGTKFDLQPDFAASLISRRSENFFSDYIRLLGLARMQHQQPLPRDSLLFGAQRRDIFDLRLSFVRGLTETDFHFLSLVCRENVKHFPEVMQLRVWLLRYVFLCQRSRPSGGLRAALRCQDLTNQLGFNKVRVKVDMCY